MQAPSRSNHQEALASERLAGKDITEGLGNEIEDLHRLSVLQRGREVSFFVLLYAAGALLAFYSDRFEPFFR